MNWNDLSFASVVCLQVTILLGLAAVLTALLRRQSAALRHRVWLLAVLASIGAPLLTALLPKYRVAILPAVARAVVVNEVGPANESPPPVEPSPRVAFPEPAPPVEVLSTVANDNIVESPPNTTEAPVATPVTNTVPATTPPAPWFARIPWRGAFAVVWLLGVAVSLIRVAVEWTSLRRTLNASRPLVEETWQVDAAWAARQLGLASVPAIRLAEATAMPMVTGVARPALLVPQGALDWSAERRRQVLLHELAHVVRGDIVSGWLARMATTLYWFHPLVWYAARRMRIERELACDDCVVAAGSPPVDYASELVSIAREYVSSRRTLALEIADNGNLESRIGWLLDRTRSHLPLSRKAGLAIAFAALLLTFAFASIRLTPKQTANAEEPKPATDVVEITQQPAIIRTGDDTMQIRGVVVDEGGQPVKGVAVNALRAPKANETITAADGTFTVSVDRRGSRWPLLADESGGGRLGFWRAAKDWGIHPPDEINETVRIVLKVARELPVIVVDKDGQPLAGVTCGYASASRSFPTTTTDATGAAVLRIPVDAELETVFAFAPGKGLDYFHFRTARDRNSDPHLLEQVRREPVKFTLNGVRKYTVTVVDEKRAPLAGVKVWPWYVELPKKTGSDRRHFPFWLIEGSTKETSETGSVEFETIPIDNMATLTFWATREGFCQPKRAMADPQEVGGTITTTLVKQILVRGTVVDGDGESVAGAEVHIAGGGNKQQEFREFRRTNDKGEFQVFVDPDFHCVLQARKGRLISSPVRRMIASSEPPPPFSLELRPAARIHGRVTEGPNRSPLTGNVLSIQMPSIDVAKLSPQERLGAPAREAMDIVAVQLNNWAQIGPAGEYELFVSPGVYSLRHLGSALLTKSPTVAATEAKDYEVDLHSAKPNNATLTGTVIDADGSPVPNAVILIRSLEVGGRSWNQVTADADGKYHIERGPERALLQAESPDGKQMGIAVCVADATKLVIPIGPTAIGKGRLIDEKTGMPLAGRDIQYQTRLELFDEKGPSKISTNAFGGTATTKDDGTFELPRLVPGWKYEINLVHKWHPGRNVAQESSPLGVVEPTEPGPIDLGDKKFDASSKPNADPRANVNPAPDNAQQAAPKPAGNNPNVELRGQVVDEAGQPVAGVELNVFGHRYPTNWDVRDETQARSEPLPQAMAKSADDGTFVISLHRKTRFWNVLATDRATRRVGVGRTGKFWQDERPAEELEQPIKVTLAAPREIPFEVVDGDGKPIAGAEVVCPFIGTQIVETSDAAGKGTLRIPKGVPLSAVFAVASKRGFDFVSFVGSDPSAERTGLPLDFAGTLIFKLTGTRPAGLRVVDENDKPLAGARVDLMAIGFPGRRQAFTAHEYSYFTARSDADGWARFDYIPQGAFVGFRAAMPGYKSFNEYSRNIRPGEVTSEERTVTLTAFVSVKGKVVGEDGKPVAGVSVRAAGMGYDDRWDQYGVLSKDDGSFELSLLPGAYYAFEARKDRLVSPIERRVVLSGETTAPVELKLRPGARIFGKIVNVTGGAPVAKKEREFIRIQPLSGGEYDDLPADQQKLPRMKGQNRQLYVRLSANGYANENGDFEFFVNPGSYLITAGKAKRTLDVDEGGEQQLELHIGDASKMRMVGKVVLASDPKQPVENALVRWHEYVGASPPRLTELRTDASGTFTILRDAEKSLFLEASGPDGKLRAMVERVGAQREIEIRLAPTAVVKGKLVDEATDKPMAKQKARIEIRQTVSEGQPNVQRRAWEIETTTNDTGEFEFRDIAPEPNYHLALVGPIRDMATPSIHAFQVEKPGELDLGTIKAKQPRSPFPGGKLPPGLRPAK